MTTALAICYVLMFVLASIAFVWATGSRLFRFPFLYSTVWLAFVLTALAEFIQHGGYLYDVYDHTGVIDITLILIPACIFGGLLGYFASPRMERRDNTYKVSSRDTRRMHRASLVIAAMSYSAFVTLAQLGGGLTEYILYSGAYTITWEGLPVYLVFVVRFGYVAIVIQLWLWSRSKKKYHLYLALAFSIIPFINIFFIFRRSEVLTIGVYFGYFVANYTKVKIGRTTAVISVALMYLVFLIFPFLRSESGKDLTLRELLVRGFAERPTFENSEIGSGLFRIYTSMTSGSYEYGAVFWNAFVKQFVPTGLVGADIKNALLINQIVLTDNNFTSFKFYTSPMGFAQAYQQFWFFGCLIFVAIGAIVAKLEANKVHGPRQEIFFVLMIPALLSAVSADLSLLVTRSITYAVLVALCVPTLHRVSNRSPNQPIISGAPPTRPGL
ncbi:MAG: hypothetical protein AAFR36_21845 [Bacteroidota bacterium]